MFFLPLSLSLMNFQRSGGDFTVTFSDSYVSHYMWAGGREGESAVIRPAVLFFSGIFSQLRHYCLVSGQIWESCDRRCFFLFSFSESQATTTTPSPPAPCRRRPPYGKIRPLRKKINQKLVPADLRAESRRKGKGAIMRGDVTAQPEELRE